MIKKKVILVFLMMVILPLSIFPVTTIIINNRLLDIFKEEYDRNDKPLKAIGALSFYNEVFTTYFERPSLLEETRFYQNLFDKNPEVTRLSVLLDNTVLFDREKEVSPRVLNDGLQESHYTLDLKGKSLALNVTYSPLISKVPDIRIRNMVAGFGFVAICLYLTFSSLFVLYILKSFLPPIDQLKQVANKISQKDYNIAIDTTRKDEIGEAFQAFDQMRKSIQTYENNQKDFIANISHDLKTPITSIKGYMAAIQDGMAKTPEKMDKYISVIQSNTLHMEQLVDDLFLFSKLDVDQVDFDFKLVAFDKFMDYLLDDIRLELEPQGISVLWDFTVGYNYNCLVDSFKMQRVIINIVSNAVKHFNKVEKVLRFSLQVDRETVVLTITDNGEGIPEADLPHVFNRFYRGDSSRNTATGSTGLGLAICRQIIEKHGGTIVAKSQIDQGTAIVISLPSQKGGVA